MQYPVLTLRWCRRRLEYCVEWEPSKRMRLEQAAGAQRSTLQPICRAGARDLAHGDLTPRCISEERQRRAGPSCPNLSHFRAHIVGLVQNTLAQLCCFAIICKYSDVESCLCQFIAFRPGRGGRRQVHRRSEFYKGVPGVWGVDSDEFATPS